MNALYLIPVLAVAIVGPFFDWRIFVATALVVGGCLGAAWLMDRMGGKGRR